MNFSNTLNKWISAVSSQDMCSVLELYADDGVLLGTYSKHIRQGKDEIQLYFEKFLTKKPKATIIKSTINHLADDSCVINGFYDFKIEGGEVVNARFSFVFKAINNSIKIVAHHSSILP